MKIIFQIISYFIIFISSLFSLVTGIINSDPAVTAIKENLGMDIESSQVEFHEDTHGWFGDGEEIIIFTPTAEQIKEIRFEWQKTPVETEIASLIFPETEYNGLELSGYIPNSEGWWLYKNRNYFSDGYSYNFSFAIFDGEKVYYYELDT